MSVGKGFDYLSLISGRRFKPKWPAKLVLYLNGGDGPIADYIGNAPGFCIMSARMLAAVKPLVEGMCEVFEAPLVDGNDERLLRGFYIVNVLNVIDCVDLNKSLVSRDQNGRVRHLNHPSLDYSKIPESSHLFRVLGPDRYPDSRLFVSDVFAQELSGKGFTGIGFIRA